MYQDDVFQGDYKTTIGVDFKLKTVNVDGKVVKLNIWDTAGQERFRTLTASYFKGAHGVLVVYDITDSGSFAQLTDWMEEIDKHASEDIARMVVGNKCDLE